MTTLEKLKKKQEEYSRITAKRRKLRKKMKYMAIEDKRLEKVQLELLEKIENMRKEIWNDNSRIANLLAGEKG